MLINIILVIVYMPILFGAVSYGSVISKTYNIMPLGDSITRGNWTSDGGYRSRLKKYMETDVNSFDFVGILTDNSAGMIDPDHAGFSGYKIDQIETQVASMPSILAPDIVLLDAGTNDINLNYTLSGITLRYSYLIDRIIAKFPKAKIIVATVGRFDSAINETNAVALNTYIMNLDTDYPGVVYPLDMKLFLGHQTSDGIHPSADGYDCMARAWWSVIRLIIQ